jgi:hypothetical protein
MDLYHWQFAATHVIQEARSDITRRARRASAPDRLWRSRFEYLDWSSGKRRKLVHLKRSLRTIWPGARVHDRGSENAADQRDVPYQSLLKVFLAERLTRERQQRSG